MSQERKMWSKICQSIAVDDFVSIVDEKTSWTVTVRTGVGGSFHPKRLVCAIAEDEDHHDSFDTTHQQDRPVKSFWLI